MLKNIQATDRTPGTRAVDPVIGWRPRPHLYASEQLIDSGNTLRQIFTQEYREACIDPALSESRFARRHSQTASRLPASESPLASTVSFPSREIRDRRVALKEEFPQAVRVYDKAVRGVRQLMSAAILGQFHAGMAVETVEGLIASLEGNPDALLCLSFMRHGPYVYTHCANVSILLAAFALSAKKEKSTIMAYGLAGLLHDLGKAMLPVSLLNARRKLTENEQKLMRLHPLLAHEILSLSPGFCPEALAAAFEHHERYDGSGYPRGVSGGDISEIGHLAGIADTYDALSSRRPYKEAVNPHKSLGLLYTMRKKAFHPQLVEQFVRMVGVYPVGSVVELKDGCRGVVSAGNPDNPIKPSIVLVLDPRGKAMRMREFDLAKDALADISHYIPAELSGIDPYMALGLTH